VTYIIGEKKVQNEVMLYDASGREFQLILVGEPEPIVVDEPKEEVKEMTEEEKVLTEVARLQAELEALKKGDVTLSTKPNGGSNVKKNQKPGKANASRKYVLLDKELKSWGKVPQQQADIAKLLGVNMEVGKEYTEAEVFDMLMEKSAEYNSLLSSKQDPTYLFRWYRGLKNDGKHAGFIARGFLRMF
jgi:hypothetical protein